jgi:hypothetical protein
MYYARHGKCTIPHLLFTRSRVSLEHVREGPTALGFPDVLFFGVLSS